jgi:nitrate/TMAO reductase-like tetraheme cytochrome c subunit
MNRKIILVVAVVALGILLGTFEGSSNPRFCGSCHEMESYVEGWKASSHQDVSCIDCHFEPGYKNYIKGKVGAFKYVRKHFASDSFSPEADVKNSSCLQCHADVVDMKLRVNHSIVLETEAKCGQCHKLGHKL